MRVVSQKVPERRFYRFLGDFWSPWDLKIVVFDREVLQKSVKSTVQCWDYFLLFWRDFEWILGRFGGYLAPKWDPKSIKKGTIV